MISAIIVVKDRDSKRVENCIDSFIKCQDVKEILIIDYCSKEPFKLDQEKPRTRIIRYDKNALFNKPHALNLGIKQATQPFIMQVDCDIILSPDFMEKVSLKQDYFIYTSRVRRIEPALLINEKNEKVSFEQLWNHHSQDWIQGNPRYSKANGGVQIFPKEWISGIGGHDERLVYWGATDNDCLMRARNSGLALVELNEPILHQEHEKKKESHIDDPTEQRIANWIRLKKAEYIYKKDAAGIYLNEGPWGEETPNQDFFLDLANNLKVEILNPKEATFQEAMERAIVNRQGEFNFSGISYELNYVAKPKQ